MHTHSELLPAHAYPELTAITSMLAKLVELMGMLAKLAENYEDAGRSNPDECHCPAAVTSAPRYIFI